LESHSWKDIALSEISGNKKSLESDPFISTQNVLSWNFSGVKDSQKTYTYDVWVSSGEPFLKNFKWAYRSTGDWIEQDFDFDNNNFWRRQSIPSSSIVFQVPQEKYYGKANPYGIIMNRTRFDFPDSAQYDFKIILEDEIVFEISVNDDHLTLTPKQFYDMGITNIILDLTNIQQEAYELYSMEVEKILSQNSNLDFQWQVSVPQMQMKTCFAPENFVLLDPNYYYPEFPRRFQSRGAWKVDGERFGIAASKKPYHVLGAIIKQS